MSDSANTQPAVEDDLDSGRRLARRRMAWISFLLLVVISSIIVWTLVFNDSRYDIASALNVAVTPLTAIYTVFTSIVLGYLGVSVVEKIFRR